MTIDRQRVYHKRDRVRQLRAFCHAARLGSITQAAVYLGLSQPAVSLHVRELENELQAILFDRGASGIRLTSAGETLYELSRSLVQGMDALSANFMERIDDTVSGRLQLAASVAGASAVLPPFIREFRDRYPDVRLRVRNCLLSDGVKLLLDDEVEFVLGVKDPYPEDSLEYRQILPYDIVLITSLDHPLSRSRDGLSAGGFGVARDRALAGHLQPAVRRDRGPSVRIRCHGGDQGRRVGGNQALRRAGPRNIRGPEHLHPGNRSALGHPAQGVLSHSELRRVHATRKVPDAARPAAPAPHDPGNSRAAPTSCAEPIAPVSAAPARHRVRLACGFRSASQVPTARSRSIETRLDHPSIARLSRIV